MGSHTSGVSPEIDAGNVEHFVKRDGMNWVSVTAFTIFHIGAVAALFFFTWPAFLTALALYWVSLSFGIGMGYRLLTHRSYKAPKWIEHSFGVCGALALEGGPVFWVAVHRAHHKFADMRGDPYTPREGKWWAHIIWMLVGNASHRNLDECSRYAPDMLKDPFHVWLSRYHYVPLTVVGALAAFGAGHFCFGACFSVCRLVNMPPGWSTRPLIFGAAAGLRPVMIPGTTGGWRC